MTRRWPAALALIVAALCLAWVAWWAFFHHRAEVVERPRYIFVNETGDRRHDLALKMSLTLAEKRSGIENALILLKRLPPDSSIEQAAVSLFQRWQIGNADSIKSFEVILVT